jgi:UDP-glucose 4-epimerase
MNILVTGGAGYVGSIVAEELLKAGYDVIVLDNLQQGHKEAVPLEAEFVLAHICDADALGDVFHQFKIDAVMHMAAETVVEYSITDPKRYFQNNVVGGINLLDTMLKHNVYKLIFSSSAAVYGEPQSIPVQESHPTVPVNAYGESKLMFERILEWYGKAYGLKHISLRYFNAAGASKRFGADHHPATHLIPNILKTALRVDSNLKVQGSGLTGNNLEHRTLNIEPRTLNLEPRTLNIEPVNVFGTDYPTKDGTCIRDYIHVVDIARAHILALAKLGAEPETRNVERRTSNVEPRTAGLGWEAGAYNLGNGEGYSVLEVIETAKKVTGIDIPTRICPRRPGDPAVLVASSNKARTELGWKPEFPKLESIIESAWRWMREHPEGYGGSGFKVQGSGFKVQGSGFKVQGSKLELE